MGETLDAGNSESGFNFNVGLSYELNDKFFLQGQYDYIRYSQAPRPDVDLGFLKFGIGFRF